MVPRGVESITSLGVKAIDDCLGGEEVGPKGELGEEMLC